VSNRQSDNFSSGDFVCEGAFAAVLLFKVHPLALEARWLIGCKRGLRVTACAVKAWKQTVLNKDLEAITYAQNRSALINKSVNLLAQLRGKFTRKNHACTHVIAKGEAAWKHQHIIIQKVTALY